MPETPPQQQRRWTKLCQQHPDSTEVIHTCADGWTIQVLHHGNDIRRVGHFLANCWQHTTCGMMEAFYSDPTETRFCTLNDQEGIPRAAFFWVPADEYISAPMRHHNRPSQAGDWKHLLEWQPDSRSLKAVRHHFGPQPPQQEIFETRVVEEIEVSFRVA